MADDNPFDFKFGSGLLGLLGAPSKAKPLNALIDWTPPSSTPEVGGLLGSLGTPWPSVNDKPKNALADWVTPPSSTTPAMGDLLGLDTPTTSPFSLAALGLEKPQPPASLFGNALANISAPQPPAPFGFGALFSRFPSADPPTPAPSVFGSLFEPTPSNPLTVGALSGHFPSSDPPPTFGALYPSSTPPPKPVTPAVKRKAFFSFHYDDVMRTSVVRKAWMFKHPDNALMPSFYDSSLWESKKLEDDEAVKRLIRDGVWNTSAVCVLAGSETYERRWVRYEIARAIIDGRGLLTVHLNSIRHHVTKTPHTRGPNPLDYMAVGKVQTNTWDEARYFLYEQRQGLDSAGGCRWGWFKYDDYRKSVDLPRWLTDPTPGHVTPLSNCAAEYDYMADDGHKNIGSWIDSAARRAGR
jgi:hypothetical protein